MSASNGDDRAGVPTEKPVGPRNEAARMQDASLSALHDQLNREKKEPSELAAPLPVSVVFLCSAVIAWAAFYFGSTYNNFSWKVTDPNYDPAMASVEPPPFDPIKAGARLYAQNCVQCHQTDGNGVAGAFPPLNGSRWIAGDGERFAAILLNGLVGEIEVKGNTYNGNMPAFGGNLNDRNLAAVMTYVRQAWDNDYPIVTEEAVAAARARFGGRPAPWSGPEILGEFPLE